MLECKIRKAKGRRVVKLQGEMTVQNIPELRRILLELLDGGGDLFLNLEGVKEVDLPGLELLCSAQLTAVEMGMKLISEDGVPELLKRVIADSGFHYSLLSELEGGKGG